MKKLLLIFLSLIISISLPSCSNQVTKSEYKAYFFDWFDTVTVITGYEETKAEFDSTVKEIEMLFSKYHKLYDIYTRYDGINNLALINEKENGSHKVITVDKEIIDLLSFSKEMFQKTGGKFNIASGSLLSVWHTYRELGKDSPENAELPPITLLQEAARHIDIKSIEIDNENRTVFISDPNAKLDVGAVAKGYACEMVAKYLENIGKDSYVINAGGNIRAIGKKPSGEKWVVGIENPNQSDKDNPYIELIELDGKALVTSGNYQRFYVVNEKNYHHIIDTETLMPSEYYLSVSVLANDSGIADSLSTALFNMPINEGISLLESFDGVEALWVLPDSERVYSSGFQGYLKK